MKIQSQQRRQFRVYVRRAPSRKFETLSISCERNIADGRRCQSHRKKGEVQIVQAVQSLRSVQVVENGKSGSICSNRFSGSSGLKIRRVVRGLENGLAERSEAWGLLAIYCESSRNGFRLICNQVRFPETAFNGDSRSMRCDELGYEYGVPSLRTNRPSALELIMSMSEQVVRSFVLREPTSR